MEEASKLFEIITDVENSNYIGFINHEDEDGTVFEIVDSFGRYKSLLWVRDKHLEFLDQESEELEVYRHFVDYSKKKALYDPHDLKAIDIDEEEDVLEDILLKASWMEQLVGIESKSEDDLNLGYIKEFNWDRLVMTIIDPFNCETLGDIDLRIDDIISVEFNSVEYQLHRYANNMVSKGVLKES